MNFQDSFDKLLPRPWVIDDLDQFKQKWLRKPWKKVGLFMPHAWCYYFPVNWDNHSAFIVRFWPSLVTGVLRDFLFDFFVVTWLSSLSLAFSSPLLDEVSSQMRLRWNRTLRQTGPEGDAEPECSMCEDEGKSVHFIMLYPWCCVQGRPFRWCNSPFCATS
jgi:hypothetical protein